MKILVFDTETTGLPEKKASIYEYKKWPYIIQISYIIYDFSLNDISIKDYYIKIDNDTEISPESFSKHKITREILDNKGLNIIDVMNEFNNELKLCDIVVGHNVSFDKRMVFVECLRNKIEQNFTTFKDKKKIIKPEYCTMKNTKEFCNFIKFDSNNKSYLKYPSLTELYTKLFPHNNIPENLHNSLVDILITLRCYIKINHNVNITDINDEVKELFIKFNCL
jgi:DNA polymerase III epsilon subunit-like protein